MRPYFSIVTPVYNGRRFLKQCVESVLKQTEESWELLLVDDGSTDGSAELCDSFCMDRRIRVLHQKNQGQLKSREKGIAEAQGRYVLGLDADDYLEKSCLERVRKAAEESGSDAVFFGYCYTGLQKGSVRWRLEGGREYTRKEALKEVIETTNHALWNKAVRLEKAKRAEKPEIKRRLDVNEDYVQAVSILCEAESVYVLDEILYHYRVYGGSISHGYRVKHLEDTEAASRYVLRKLRKHGLLERDMYEAVLASYLKMAAPRLERLFYEGGITRKECRRLRKYRVYQRTGRVEKREKFSRREYGILKLFRLGQYGLLRMYAGLGKQ